MFKVNTYKYNNIYNILEKKDKNYLQLILSEQSKETFYEKA